jgi:hypothetical protein
MRMILFNNVEGSVTANNMLTLLNSTIQHNETDECHLTINPGELISIDYEMDESKLTLYYEDWYLVLGDDLFEMMYHAYVNGGCVTPEDYAKYIEEEQSYVERLKFMPLPLKEEGKGDTNVFE